MLDVEWKSYSSTDGEYVVLIRGKVRHSYSSSKSPLLPWMIIKQSGAVVVAHCTCTAGLAETCTHVGAILHWVEAAVRVNISTTCTSKENSWLMPTPRESIPFLELNQINFTTRQQEDHGGLHTAIQVPTSIEKKNLIADLAKEKEKMPIVLSVIDPYNAAFITTDKHLPPIFSTLYDPANSNTNYSELLKIAADYNVVTTTTDKVKRLAQLTVHQSKSKLWFKYRAGRITASRFRQIIHTNPYQPSLSLLNRFSSDAVVSMRQRLYVFIRRSMLCPIMM